MSCCAGSEELLSQARARLVREKADAGVDPLAPWNSGNLNCVI